MFKADVNDEYTKLEIVGDLKDICTDLSRILSAVNERLSEKSEKIGHDFRMMFTKGFMDGVCFDDDREHMEHYLAEADEKMKKEKNDKEKFGDFAEFLDDFLSWLKEKNEELEKFNKAFEDSEGEKDDEAE